MRAPGEPLPSPVWNAIAKDERLRDLALPRPGTPLTPAEAKNLAVTYGLRGVGQVAPNPLVGAVIVDGEHRFIAAGAHERVGGDHAELAALRAAVPDAARWPGALRGNTLYVTLEPCAHDGKRTPPCAPQMAAAGFARVVYGAVDPNPRVSGRGVALLNAAGIETLRDEAWARACEQLAEIYLKNTRAQAPFVGLKAAASLDGVIARRGDRRQWLTGARARQYGHFLRLWYDAVLVGRGTVEADDPTLDARDALVAGGRVPWRVVLDPQHRAFAGAHKLRATAPEKLLWLVDEKLALDAPHAVGLPLDAHGRLPARAVLAALAAKGITSVLLEGGAGAYGAFLAAGLVDKLHLFQAPSLLGADNSVRLTDHAGALAGGPAQTIDLTPLGDDWLVEAGWETT